MEAEARRGAFSGAFAASGAGAVGSAPARPPEEPADVGLEKRRVAAFVITRSGGASSGDAGSGAGAGRPLGSEPNGLIRLYQPGPEEGLGAGRRPAN